MKVLIIGSNGQDGFYLGKLLKKKGIHFTSISRRNADIIGDVSDYNFIKIQIQLYLPDIIFHFAAQSTTKHDVLFENHATISTGTLNILEAVRVCCPNSKVFISGSALQFENRGIPINENTPFTALSPYAVSRIQSVYAARYYRDIFAMKVYVGYFFNHDSPLRSERHINQKIISAIKRIKAGSDEKIEIGNIDVSKEFNFAGDIVEAVWILINQDKVYEAVIGNGLAYSIKDWITYCFEKAEIKWQNHVLIKKDFIPEYDILVSNPTLIKSLGWKSKVTFNELADMMWDNTFI